MIRHTTCLIILLLSTFSLTAQTIRTDVTVVGASAAGISAGIQAARSGVRSLVIEESQTLNPQFTAAGLVHLSRIRDHYTFKNETLTQQKDSLKRENVRTEETGALVKSITDTVKNFTLMLNTGIRGIEKDGKGWEIKLKNGRTIKTDVVIDASKG